MKDKLQHINLGEDATLADLRNAVNILLNVVEELWSNNEALRKENDDLKDEVNRLKGEQAKPQFKPKKNKDKPNKDYSSTGKSEDKDLDKEKVNRRDKIVIDKTLKIEVAVEALPADAYFTGYAEVVVQNAKLVRENILYKVATYYSSSEKRSIRGQLPSSYVGQYGADLEGLLHGLHHVCDVTQSRLACLLESLGIVISSGKISNILNGELAWAQQEQQAILATGIEASDYVQTDSTSNKEKGEKRTTHIFSGAYFSVYSTLESKSRLSVLHGLQGGVGSTDKLKLQYNKHTEELLAHYNIAQIDRAALRTFFAPLTNQEAGKVINLGTFKSRVAQRIPSLAAKRNMFIRVQHAFALSHYYEQTTIPSAKVLLSDDAPEYKKIALDHHALCWVHDARHYNKLSPIIPHHQQLKESFMEEYWTFYKKLLTFRKVPIDQVAQQIEQKALIDKEFDRIFSITTHYDKLDKLIENTKAKKAALLVVLELPTLPLHNNAAELAARRIVRKRDISLHTWSEVGTQTRDAFLSIVETAIKVGCNPFDYIVQKIKGNKNAKSLAQLVKEAYLPVWSFDKLP